MTARASTADPDAVIARPGRRALTRAWAAVLAAHPLPGCPACPRGARFRPCPAVTLARARLAVGAP